MSHLARNPYEKSHLASRRPTNSIEQDRPPKRHTKVNSRRTPPAHEPICGRISRVQHLITGGAGFIGSHLARLLVERGENVVVLDNLSTGRFENIRPLVGRPNFTYLIADLADEAITNRAIEQADTIFHLAAAVGVQLIVDDPVRTIETNIEGAARVLRLAARWGKRVLVTSTSEVYGKGVAVPFREDDDVLYGPTSRSRWSYAFSKAVDEFLALAYHQTQGLPAVVVRLFNTVGPGQVGHYGMVVPRFIDQALAGGPITVFGDGEQSRCFCHVQDIVPALAQLAQTPAAWGQVVNLGSTEEISVRQLAERIADKINPSCEIRSIPYDQAYKPGFEDMRRRVPSLEKAERLIGYRARHGLDQILDDMIAWQQEHRAHPEER
ncbi:GDP-mannose 4,6-dehydratase [bacterium]|nr:GDP-mannose 4,6-dehydratase [bacterium]